MKDSRLLFACLSLTLLINSLACVQQQTTDTGNTTDNNSNDSAAAKGELRTTPPFSTKEPDRYRATLVTMGSLPAATTSETGRQSSVAQSSSEQREVVARDGDRRRVDYELPTGKKISLLQTPDGAYLLDADKRIYADVAGSTDAASMSGNSDKAIRNFSPNELLGKARASARYEKLGAETVNGRAATKYRVTPASITGEAKSVMSESLIWIDDLLQMPIKQEIVSTDSAKEARWVMELRDIETNVPADSFEIPANYRKAPLSAFFPQAENAPRR